MCVNIAKGGFYMKKLFSLLMAILMLVTVAGVAPTVFAEELPYTEISKEMFDKYWGGFRSDGVVKMGDWYYSFKENSATNEKNIFAVCGYDGNETEITIPTELDGIEITNMYDFQLLSNTVKTIKIPRKISEIIDGRGSHFDSDCYIKYMGKTRLEEIMVESGNRNFWSRDGVLYQGDVLCFYPPEKKDTEYIVPEQVTEIAARAINNQKYLKSVTITQNVSLIDVDSLPDTLEHLYVYTTEPLVGNIEERYFPHISNGIAYMPSTSKGTVYCIEGSEAHSFYKDNEGLYCKKLEVLKDNLVKESDGKWYYYCNDYKMNSSTLVKYKGKWFYVTNGVWDKTITDKIIKYKNKDFYIKNGKWDSSVNTLIKKNGEWLGIVNGKWDTSANTLIKYKGKWFYVKNGEWCKKTAIVKYKGKRFYVKNGKVDFDFSGKKKIDGKTYKIKNGKVA